MNKVAISLFLLCLSFSLTLGGRIYFLDTQDKRNNTDNSVFTSARVPAPTGFSLERHPSQTQTHKNPPPTREAEKTYISVKSEPFAAVLLGDLFPQSQAQGALPQGLVELIGLTESQVNSYNSALELGRSAMAELERANAKLSTTEDGQPCVDVASFASEAH